MTDSDLEKVAEMLAIPPAVHLTGNQAVHQTGNQAVHQTGNQAVHQTGNQL